MQDDFGKLVVRLSIGGLLLLHGAHKLLNGVAPVKAMVVAHHLPELAAYGVYAGEIVGPVLVILGLFARIGGALIAANMLVAVVIGGMGSILMLNEIGGYALEVEALFLLGGVSIFFLGAGRLSFGVGGRFN